MACWSLGWGGLHVRAEQPVPRADDESQSAERSRRGRCSPSRSPGSALIWRVVTRLQILCGYTRRRPSGWAREGCCEEKMVVALNSLLVLLMATPSLHGSAGVWQFPAYGPSPRPLEAPTPRVARAAIPKDLVSGITVKSFNPSLIV